MIDSALVRGLLRFFAGTVVLDHNVTFSIWRKLDTDVDPLLSSLRRDQEFLRRSEADLVGLCREIGCVLPADFHGLSRLSSVAVGSSDDANGLCSRFQNDHMQMVEDAQFLLVVSRFESLPPSKTVLIEQSATHGTWAAHWGASRQAKKGKDLP